MTSDGVLVIQTLFGMIFSLFTSWHIPGTRATPAEWFFFVLGSYLAVKAVKRIFQFGDDVQK